MTPADRARDSHDSYNLGIAAWREIRVRSGEYPPVNETERQWAAEGPRENRELETVANIQKNGRPR